jgi:hypothetical protein
LCVHASIPFHGRQVLVREKPIHFFACLCFLFSSGEPTEEAARGVRLPDSDSEEAHRPDPIIWQKIRRSYREELLKERGGYSIYDFYIPLGDIYVFLKERLVGEDEELLKNLEAYDFDTLAEAVHVKWRLILLDKVRETKKRKRELDDALDLVEYMPAYIKKARGDSRPVPSGLE